MDERLRFIGGEAPFAAFEDHFHRLFHIVESHKQDVGEGPLQHRNNPAVEAAFIGLVAHFEAFCKHQFAALINADRSLLRRFAAMRPEAAFKLSDIVKVIIEGLDNPGALIAEHFDFGSAKLINGLFRDLVGITPFAKGEAIRFDRLLNERHLLVHHAGIYTIDWISKGWDVADEANVQPRDRLSLCTADYGDRLDFLFDIAMKIVRTSVRAGWQLSDVDKSAREDQWPYTQMLEARYDSLDDIAHL